jgi:Fur family ferric uptake transcriptional regulator
MERNTVQRRAVQRALVEAGRPVGPAEIHAIARTDAPGLGIATVYRCIKRLLDEGTIVAVDLPGEAPRYELAGKEHHHHFRCNACERVYDLTGCPDRFDTLTPKGFQLTGHEVYLFGTCRDCAAGA